MRFADPRNFGILSPPVEKLLGIGPTHNPREKYLKYVKALRAPRDGRGFESAAEVDMALWVMGEVIDAARSRSHWLQHTVPEHEQWDSAFSADATLREIRVRNLTESLFGTMTLAQLAEALVPRHMNRVKQDQMVLAARIAGIEFEQAVIQVAGALSPEHSTERSTPDLMRVVRTLRVSPETRERWVQAVRIGNNAVHGVPLHRGDVDQLLRTMREVLDRAGQLTRPG